MERIIKITRREKRIGNVYLLAFILLFLCYVLTLFGNRELRRQAGRVEHTNNVLKTLDNVIARVIDGETGVRGYVLSKDLAFLFPYYGTQKKTDSLLQKVNQLTLDNPVQHTRLVQLKKDISRRFEILAFSLNSFNSHNQTIADSMILLQSEVKSLMNNIRSNISLMEREENRLLVEREQRMKKTTLAINTIAIVSLVLVFALLIFGFATYMQVSKQRKKAEKDVLKSQEMLNKRIVELDKANTELIEMRSQEQFAITGRIARTIGHEVRNPLTNIMLASDQLKTDFSKLYEEKSYLLDMIDRNSSRINQLISDLLDSTKTSELDYEKVPITELIEESLNEAADRIALTNVKLVKNYGEAGTCLVEVDKVKMKIALLNIIMNAVEAMHGKENSELTISATTKKGKCEIKIQDNGPGINAETLQRLFEPYFTTKKTGNGLGLTNTQNIIISHRGEISVDSVLGKGTCFRIILSLAI